jgi:alpha-galactosidase
MSEEMLHTSVWLKKHLIPESGKEIEPPFSFVYDGRSSAEFFSTCQQKLETRALDRGRKEHVITWTGPSGLAVKCRAIEYLDFPTVEWVLYFKNTDSEDTKILENIRAIDVQINRPGKEEFILHHHTGSGHAQNDFQPHQTVLATGAAKSIASIGGRPTNGALPYFNIEMPGEKVTIIEEKTAIWKRTRIEQQPANGVIVVVGWPGQWLAEFTRDSSDKLRIRADDRFAILERR